MIIIEHKTEKITFRVTPAELKIIDNKLKKTNIKLSEFVRQSALDKEIVIIEDLAIFSKELRFIGKNLNQLVILTHQGKITCPNIDNVERMVEEIWLLLNSLMVKTKRKKN